MQEKNQHYLFTKILKKYKYSLTAGDVVAGTIIYRETNGFLVEIGDIITGYLPIEEITIEDKQKRLIKLQLINQTRDFFLITKDTKLKQYILSIKRLEYIRAWKRIKQLYLEDIIFNLIIQQINKGGIITHLEGIQGFIPKSHLLKQLYTIKNKNITCKLLISNEIQNQLIFSHRSAIICSYKYKLKLGELLYGKVLYIKNYGIFIEIHKIIALLHISEIKEKYINNTNKYFFIGQIMKIKIIHIDTKQGRISVSTRSLK